METGTANILGAFARYRTETAMARKWDGNPERTLARACICDAVKLALISQDKDELVWLLSGESDFWFDLAELDSVSIRAFLANMNMEG